MEDKFVKCPKCGGGPLVLLGFRAKGIVECKCMQCGKIVLV